LIQINVVWLLWALIYFMLKDQRPPDKWLPVSIAPSDRDLEVCVIDKRGSHALVFPVRKSGTDWLDASTKERIDIEPTHWRKWTDQR
jgi:hypothetical protein